MSLNISSPRSTVTIRGTGNGSRDTRMIQQAAANPKIAEIRIEGNLVVQDFVTMEGVDESIAGPSVGKSVIGVNSPLITVDFNHTGIGCAAGLNAGVFQWEGPKSVFLGTLDSGSGAIYTNNPLIGGLPPAVSGGDWLLFVSSIDRGGSAGSEPPQISNIRQYGHRDKIIEQFDEDFTTGTVGVWKIKTFKNVHIANLTFNSTPGNSNHCLLLGSTDGTTSLQTGVGNMWAGLQNSVVEDITALRGTDGTVVAVSNTIDTTFNNIVHEGCENPLCFYGVTVTGICKNLYFNNMKIHETRHGFTTTGADASPEDIFIYNSSFSTANLNAVDTHEAGNRIVFDGCDVNIQQNTPSGNPPVYNSKGFQIRNNTTTVKNCIIKNGGIQVLADNCIIDNCEISNPNGHGVAVGSVGAYPIYGTQIINSYIHNCKQNGIQLDSASYRVLVKNNRLESCQLTPAGNVSYCNIQTGIKVLNNYFKADSTNSSSSRFLDQGAVKVSGHTIAFNTFDSNGTSIVLWDNVDVAMPEFDTKKNWYDGEKDFVTLTGNTTLTQFYNDVLVDASGGSVTITLPIASKAKGKEINVKKIDNTANTVTIEGAGSETIDRNLNQTILNRFDNFTVKTDGVEWWIK